MPNSLFAKEVTILDRSGNDFIEAVAVPSGFFLMGSDENDTEAFEDEKPQRRVFMDWFIISKYPITKAQFRRFLEESEYEGEGDLFLNDWEDSPNGRVPSPGEEQHPVVYVSWYDAKAFCEFYGLYLPSEAQWEKAARGVDGRKYPWGNEPPNEEVPQCNFGGIFGGTTPVGTFNGSRKEFGAQVVAQGTSPYGCEDMAGNVWEWCCDKWSSTWLRDMINDPVMGCPVDPCNEPVIEPNAFVVSLPHRTDIPPVIPVFHSSFVDQEDSAANPSQLLGEEVVCFSLSELEQGTPSVTGTPLGDSLSPQDGEQEDDGPFRGGRNEQSEEDLSCLESQVFNQQPVSSSETEHSSASSLPESELDGSDPFSSEEGDISMGFQPMGEEHLTEASENSCYGSGQEQEGDGPFLFADHLQPICGSQSLMSVTLDSSVLSKGCDKTNPEEGDSSLVSSRQGDVPFAHSEVIGSEALSPIEIEMQTQLSFEHSNVGEEQDESPFLLSSEDASKVDTGESQSGQGMSAVQMPEEACSSEEPGDRGNPFPKRQGVLAMPEPLDSEASSSSSREQIESSSSLPVQETSSPLALLPDQPLGGGTPSEEDRPLPSSDRFIGQTRSTRESQDSGEEVDRPFDSSRSADTNKPTVGSETFGATQRDVAMLAPSSGRTTSVTEEMYDPFALDGEQASLQSSLVSEADAFRTRDSRPFVSGFTEESSDTEQLGQEDDVSFPFGQQEKTQDCESSEATSGSDISATLFLGSEGLALFAETKMPSAEVVPTEQGEEGNIPFGQQHGQMLAPESLDETKREDITATSVIGTVPMLSSPLGGIEERPEKPPFSLQCDANTGAESSHGFPIRQAGSEWHPSLSDGVGGSDDPFGLNEALEETSLPEVVLGTKTLLGTTNLIGTTEAMDPSMEEDDSPFIQGQARPSRESEQGSTETSIVYTDGPLLNTTSQVSAPPTTNEHLSGGEDSPFYQGPLSISPSEVEEELLTPLRSSHEPHDQQQDKPAQITTSMSITDSEEESELESVPFASGDVGTMKRISRSSVGEHSPLDGQPWMDGTTEKLSLDTNPALAKTKLSTPTGCGSNAQLEEEDREQIPFSSGGALSEAATGEEGGADRFLAGGQVLPEFTTKQTMVSEEEDDRPFSGSPRNPVEEPFHTEEISEQQDESVISIALPLQRVSLEEEDERSPFSFAPVEEVAAPGTPPLGPQSDGPFRSLSTRDGETVGSESSPEWSVPLSSVFPNCSPEESGDDDPFLKGSLFSSEEPTILDATCSVVPFNTSVALDEGLILTGTILEHLEEGEVDDWPPFFSGRADPGWESVDVAGWLRTTSRSSDAPRIRLSSDSFRGTG